MTSLETAKRPSINIDLLYLDLEVCARCRGTDANMEKALTTVQGVLEATGVAVQVTKTLVDSQDKARAVGFVSSPTIRVNGSDIALDLRESRCESETCACGPAGGAIDCRVWIYQGEEYTEAPVPMIVDAILSGVYSGMERTLPTVAPATAVPENLRRFFRAKPSTAAKDCCDARTKQSCCGPEEEVSCCGPTRVGEAARSCGCQ
jgi:hypothetical protein